MTRLRWWGVGASFCWLVALLLLIAPVSDGERCGRPVTVALSSDDSGCAEKAAGRLQGLAFWLLLTAPVTLGYLARKAAAPE